MKKRFCLLHVDIVPCLNRSYGGGTVLGEKLINKRIRKRGEGTEKTRHLIWDAKRGGGK